jgi:tight adherence protein B
MITALAAACVFVSVWTLFLPSPAALRLSAVLHSPPSQATAGSPVPTHPAQTAIAWLRRAAGSLAGRRRETARRRAAIIELCDGIAAELTAGRPPDTALSYAAEVLPSLPGLTAVVDAAQNGDDVPAALTRAAGTEGCDGLRLLAGCWRVGVDRGGMLAAVIEGLAEALRDEQSHRDDIALQLAGPRATARLLAGLPILGLGMAAVLGAKPLSFLFATLPGAMCLTLGIGLDALGLWWTAHLATAAEQSQ